jgi:hypothetical protein
MTSTENAQFEGLRNTLFAIISSASIADHKAAAEFSKVFRDDLTKALETHQLEIKVYLLFIYVKLIILILYRTSDFKQNLFLQFY